MDFVSDVTETGRRFRVLTIVEDFSRRSVALVADTSLEASRPACVVRPLFDSSYRMGVTGSYGS